jgi:hypothetical protein
MGPRKEILVVGNDYLKNSKTCVVGQLLRENLLTSSEFAKKLKGLKARGLLYQPRKVHVHSETSLSKVEYEPPTIDTSADFLAQLAPFKAGKQRKKNSVLEISRESSEES